MYHAVYHSGRKVAGVAASFLHGSGVEQGDIYNRIREDVGEDEYERLCQDTGLVLETISYCQSELSIVGDSLRSCRKSFVPDFDETERIKRLINHDFLILKLQPGVRIIPNVPKKSSPAVQSDPCGLSILLYIMVFAPIYVMMDLMCITLIHLICVYPIYRILKIIFSGTSLYLYLVFFAVIVCQILSVVYMFHKSIQSIQDYVAKPANFIQKNVPAVHEDVPAIPQHVPAIHILAEKVASGQGSRAGIHIYILPEPEEIERRCCLYRIECRSKIGLNGIMTNLKKKGARYDIRNDNCWDYARKTTKFLLEACIRTKTKGCGDYWRLQKKLDDVEYNIVSHHFVNTGKRVWNYVKTHMWDRIFD